MAIQPWPENPKLAFKAWQERRARNRTLAWLGFVWLVSSISGACVGGIIVAVLKDSGIDTFAAYLIAILFTVLIATLVTYWMLKSRLKPSS